MLGAYLAPLVASKGLEASREPAGAKATLAGSEELLCQEADHGHLTGAPGKPAAISSVFVSSKPCW